MAIGWCEVLSFFFHSNPAVSCLPLLELARLLVRLDIEYIAHCSRWLKRLVRLVATYDRLGHPALFSIHHQDSTPMDSSLTHLSQRLVGIVQRHGRHSGTHTVSGGKMQSILEVFP